MPIYLPDHALRSRRPADDVDRFGGGGFEYSFEHDFEHNFEHNNEYDRRAGGQERAQ